MDFSLQEAVRNLFTAGGRSEGPAVGVAGKDFRFLGSVEDSEKEEDAKECRGDEDG